MRLRDHVGIAIKDIRRQFLRSLLTIAALVISTVILVMMTGISLGGQQAIMNQFGDTASLTTITVTPNQSSAAISPFGSVQQVNANTSKLNDATVQSFASIPHVSHASARAQIWELHHFTVEGSDKQFVAQAQGIPVDGLLPLQAGEMFSSNDVKNVVIVGSGYAKEMGLGDNPQQLVGRTVQLVSQKGYRGEGAAIPGVGASREVNEAFAGVETSLSAKIIGVTTEGIDQNQIFLPLGWAHAIRTTRYNEPLGLKQIDQLENDGYTSIRLSVNDVANVKAVAAAVEVQGYGQLSTQEQIERLQQLSTTMWVLLGAVAGIAIVAAALGVVNTMLMAVSEQRYSVGVWRAVGARRKTIIGLFVTQSAIIGLFGGVLGVGLALLLSRYVNDYVNSLLAAQNLTLTSIALLPWWLCAGAIAATTLVSILAGIYPAYKAAVQDASAALKSEN